MQKKNILVLVEYFGQGGAERVGTMIAQMLHEKGSYNVWLYSVVKGDQLPELNGVNAGSLEIELNKGTTSKLFNYYRKLSRLRKIKKALKIDLTISSLWPVDWMNALTGKDKKAAVIQINILNNRQNEKMVRYKKLVTKVYNRFDGIVLGSANLMPEMADFFGIDQDKLVVITNPVETKRIDANIKAPVQSKFGDVFDRYKVCTVANRLNPIKNTDVLVFIYKRLSDANVKFLIIGEGEEKKKIQHLILSEGLKWSQVEDENFDTTAHFYFQNFQINIHNIINRSKLFLFPTKGEGLPLVLLEAMYCGVPVIASDCPNGGVSEVMQAKQPFDINHLREIAERTAGGYLMPVPSAEDERTILEWKEKIEELINANPVYREEIRSFNRNRASEFDKEKIKKKWFDFADKILNG